jgi:RNA polymerase sigma-70 factor (ECF subfamily)
VSRGSNTRASPEGLEEAYQQYRLELRHFFELNARDPQAAADLLQTLYLRVRKSRPPDDVRDPRQYLFRAAWNLLHSENRRTRAERARAVACAPNEFEAYADRSNRLWVEDDTGTALSQAELDSALSQLPRACQVTMVRKYRDNKSYKEIAAELGVSVHAVKKYVMRSLNHFRMHLNARDLGEDRERSRS